MKSILKSIKPQYCELIAKGKKTIEVRKTRPKLDVPFKVYIYCTRGKLALLRDDRDTEEKYKFDYWDFVEFHKSNGMEVLGGKVIGEYVCDKIIEYPAFQQMDAYIIPFLQQSLICLTQEELWQYGKGKTLYGWHISDLKIYDKPKELSEFIRPCDKDIICTNCDYAREDLTVGEAVDWILSNHSLKSAICINKLTHPPQSWCYVEEV